MAEVDEPDLSELYPHDVIIRIPGDSMAKVEVSIGHKTRVHACMKGAAFVRLELVVDPAANHETRFAIAGIAPDGSAINLEMRRCPESEPTAEELEDAAVKTVKQNLGLEPPEPRAPMRYK